MQNFILTGHKGLIGSNLLENLVERGDKPVRLIDRRHYVLDDIRDIGDIKLDKPVDVMYQLASYCKIKDCIKIPRLAYEHNVLGTYEVMEFRRINHSPKVVFTSSTRVIYPEKNPYTESKIYGEELVKSYAKTYGMNYTIIRPSTVYGPFDDKTNRLIHVWIKAALRDEPLYIYGDVNKTLDFTYVDDFVAGLLHLSKYNGVFDVGTGKEIKLFDVAELIISLVGQGRIVFSPAEPQQPQNVVVDTDFPCNTSIKEGLKRTVEFYTK